jgi:hypothetical protein
MARARFSVEAFDEMTKSVFAQAFERASTQDRIDPLPPGHISIEDRERGGQYAKWRRYGLDGKPLPPEYLGVAGGDAHQAALARLAELEALAASAQTLRRIGFAGEDNKAAVVLASMANAGLFSGGGVLVGTRAFRCLTNHLGFKVAPIVATQDVDLAREERISLATPFPAGGMAEFLRLTGMNFFEVPGLRPGEPATSWSVRGRDLKVDLLVAARGSRAPYSSVKVPELGAHATALSHLDYLLANLVEAMSIGKTQLIPVRVPDPARFCWHKLAVSAMRPVAQTAKIEKDLAQAACLAVCLSVDSMDELLSAARAMSTAMKKKVRSAFPRFARQFGSDYLHVLEAMGQQIGIEHPVPVDHGHAISRKQSG